ncbi:MAG: hypothetical protein LWW81_11275 [Rhodocyclales bacterium]|nr:hypothetical protein [Rhodocyclales bacterium]
MSDSAEHERNIAAAIHRAGWRTGSACSSDTLAWHRDKMPTWVRERVDGQSGLFVPFVSSQACDLVNARFSDEPHVEFILGLLDASENPGIASNKSYRRLQLRHPTKRFVEFCVHDRWYAPRAELLNLHQDTSLDLDWRTGIDLARWLGSRHSRYPLPNALAERMQYNNKRDWLKRLTAEVDEIRIRVTPPDQELGPDDPYNVVLHVIARRQLTSKASEAFDKFKTWMESLSGITAQVRLEAADKFSYLMIKDTHRLDLDALTYGYFDGPKGALPANF